MAFIAILSLPSSTPLKKRGTQKAKDILINEQMV